MAIEVWMLGASWATATVAVIGVVAQWRKNGKDQSTRDERLSLNQENIIKKLDDPNDGLAALGRKVNSMTNHCATVSTGLTERVNAAERDIKELKHK